MQSKTPIPDNPEHSTSEYLEALRTAKERAAQWQKSTGGVERAPRPRKAALEALERLEELENLKKLGGRF